MKLLQLILKAVLSPEPSAAESYHVRQAAWHGRQMEKGRQGIRWRLCNFFSGCGEHEAGRRQAWLKGEPRLNGCEVKGTSGLGGGFYFCQESCRVASTKRN